MAPARTDLDPTARERVLFVDDDASLLDGLRDALWPCRGKWNMSFVGSGEQALSLLEQTAHHVVVSDLRMPGMDGATLLEIVRDRCPEAVRVVLSGHAEMRMVARAAAVAHRLIAKPCETEELINVIERACALQRMASRVKLDHCALGTSALPAVPRLYTELTDILTSGTAGATEAARVVESDVAITAKVLQLANSAYFGRTRPVSRVSDAVAYLGLEPLRALVLHACAFQQFPVRPRIDGFSIDALQLHCTRVARLSSSIMSDQQDKSHAFTAGLLHDVGLLVLAAQHGEELAAILARARAERRPVHEIEREVHGITHAEVGAQLLALWGLPHPVSEAVAMHQRDRWLTPPLDTTAAVHIANALVEDLESRWLAQPLPCSDLNLDFIERADLTSKLSRWRQFAEQQFEAGGEN